MVYHATGRTFDAFKTNKSELGAHFGTVGQAGQVSSVKDNASVIPAYLSIEAPLRLRDIGLFSTYLVAEQLVPLGLMTQKQADTIHKLIMDDGLPEARVTPMVQQAITRGGYDGVVYLNRREGFNPFGRHGSSVKELDQKSDEEIMGMFPEAQDSWIAFKPTQIKSSVGNNGDFCGANPDICFSHGLSYSNWERAR